MKKNLSTIIFLFTCALAFAQITLTSTVSNVSCFGGSNGSAAVTATGGIGPYTYTWIPSNTTSSVLTGVAAGTYTVNVADAIANTSSLVVTITEPPQLMTSTTATMANCGQSNGSISANVFNGIGPYTIQWSNGGTTFWNNNIPGGVYSYTVIDANGCMAISSGQVNSIGGPTVSISSQTNVSCFGGCNGAVTTSISGTPPYAYSWSNGQVSASATNLCAGVYTVSVTDNAGCIGTTTVNITQPQPTNITTSVTNASCQNSCNGSISAIVTGGTPGYNYIWYGPVIGGGGSTSNIYAVCPGSFSLVVTDAMGCSTFILSYVAISGTNYIPNTTITSTSYDETCNLTGDGAIDINISGTNPGPFTYQWSNGASTQDITNLVSSIYYVSITDGVGNCGTIVDTIQSIGINCGSISGNVFIDNNSDCIKNSGDNNLSNIQIVANPGNRIGYSNWNGDYSFNNLPFGTYTITSSTNSNMFATCSTILNATINSGTPNSLNNYFSKEYIPITQPDLYTSAYSNGIVPGFVCRVNYLLHNYNTFNANGVFKVTLPPAFIPNITNAFPAAYTLSGDTIIWNFTNINYMGWNVNFYVDFTTPLSTPLGSTFTTCIWALPTVADLNYANNTYCYSRMVTGSYDPNDKTPNPIGIGSTGDIAASVTDLTYLIRFQNTGNGPAVNIKVTDTLSSNVNVNTFEMLGASHNYNIDILPGNVLRWKFNNIMLPDSNSNEPGSHGYIQYRIKRTNNNTPGTQIKNTAYIYFDFNAPVVTNTAINTIETITGIKSQNITEDQWMVYPNPSTGLLNLINNTIAPETKLHIQIVNAFGQLVYEESTSANHKTLDLTKLSNGVYFVKLVSDKQSSIKRIVLSK